MWSPFLDIRFPNAVARGSTGGPGFSTSIVTLANGAEQRNQNWSRARGRWDISTGIRTRDQMAAVIALFYAAAGRAHSFRFRDWNDFDAIDQSMLAVKGSATQFQLAKTYAVGMGSYTRLITKPVVGSVVVKVQGQPVPVSGIDPLTGLVTFAATPSALPTASFQFDVPVRFNTDHLPVEAQSFNQQLVGTIELVEVLE